MNSSRCLQTRLLAAVLALLFTSCGGRPAQIASEPTRTINGFQPFQTNGTNAKQSHGHWRTRGYGYRLAIREDRIDMFCETNSFVYRVPGEFGSFMADALFRVGDEPNTLLVTDHPSIGWRVLDRVDPPTNVRGIESGWTPRERWQVFVETMREHYAFFDLWGIDWERRVAESAAKVDSATTDAELFSICSQMLEGIDDAHFGFSATVAGEIRSFAPGKGPTKRRLRALFENQHEFDDLNAYFNAWFQSYLADIDRDVLDGHGKVAVKSRLRWGRLDGHVGYIHLTHLNGYGEATIQAGLELLENGLDNVFEDLGDCQSIILDLTYNQGGTDLLAQAVASRFADKPRLAFTKRPVTRGDHEHEAHIAPSTRKGFRGPLFVVTSDITMSAAEGLVLYLRVLPQVTLVGQPTRGAFSDMLEKPLPHGAMLTLSNEVYEAADGVCYEGRGIPVNRLLAVFDEENPWTGHTAAIETIRRMAVAAKSSIRAS